MALWELRGEHPGSSPIHPAYFPHRPLTAHVQSLLLDAKPEAGFSPTAPVLHVYPDSTYSPSDQAQSSRQLCLVLTWDLLSISEHREVKSKLETPGNPQILSSLNLFSLLSEMLFSGSSG